MVSCFVIVSVITIIIIIYVYIYTHIYYINFGFRFIDAAPYANSRNAPGSRDAQFEYLWPRVLPIK